MCHSIAPLVYIFPVPYYTRTENLKKKFGAVFENFFVYLNRNLRKNYSFFQKMVHDLI